MPNSSSSNHFKSLIVYTVSKICICKNKTQILPANAVPTVRHFTPEPDYFSVRNHTHLTAKTGYPDYYIQSSDCIVFRYALYLGETITLLKAVKSFSKTNVTVTGVETDPHQEETEDMKHLLAEHSVLYIEQIYLIWPRWKRNNSHRNLPHWHRSWVLHLPHTALATKLVKGGDQEVCVFS